MQDKRALTQKIKELRFAVLRMHLKRCGPRGGPLNRREETLYKLIHVVECLMDEQNRGNNNL